MRRHAGISPARQLRGHLYAHGDLSLPQELPPFKALVSERRIPGPFDFLRGVGKRLNPPASDAGDIPVRIRAPRPFSRACKCNLLRTYTFVRRHLSGFEYQLSKYCNAGYPGWSPGLVLQTSTERFDPSTLHHFSH